MADFGQLKQYVDDVDVRFKVGNKTYNIKPSVLEILHFKRVWDEIESTKGRKIDQTDTWETVAPLLGSKFDRESYTFVDGDDEGHPHHGLIPTLLDNGLDFATLDRLLTAIQVKYQLNDEIAEELVKTGSLGKAQRNVIDRRKQEAEKATPKEPGETTGND